MRSYALKLWQRVVIVAVTSTVPLLLIASILINNSISKDIKFTQQEMRGNHFQRPLERLLDLLPRHLAAMRQFQDGDEKARSQVATLRDQIDAAFKMLVANSQGEFGQALKFSDAELAARGRTNAQLSLVLTEWQQLKSHPAGEADSGEMTGRLVAAIRTMIVHVGDLSNLILDNELDSYYLVDSTLITLPQTQQRLSDIILYSGGWIRLGQTGAHRTDIAVQSVLLRQDDLDRVVRDAQTALGEDRRHHGETSSLQTNLPPAIEKFRTANLTVIALLQRAANGDRVSPAELETAGWAARAESFRLWETAVNELDRLLALRIAAYQRTEHMDFWAIVLTLGLTILVVWLVGAEIDITGKKETEAKLRHMRDYLANIIDSMPSAIVSMDNEHKVTQWNRGAETLAGLPRIEAVGKPVQTVLAEFAETISGLREMAQKDGVASKENLVLLREGEQEVFNLMLYSLVSDGMEGSVLRIENVTEGSRTRQILVQTEKMMSLGGLAAGMAHEINNPLGIISQASQNIERRVQPELPANQKVANELGLSLDLMKAYFERREIPVFTKDIREAVSRAAKIVNNMLQFSRKSGSERQLSSLPDVLDRTLELAGNDYDLKKHFDFRSIQIVREYQPDLPAVPVVVVEIQQVLLNLFKNAAQAMADHGPGNNPVLTLRLRQENEFAVIEVADNGPGMEDKIARRVFEPFFTTKRPGLGTGLGLSVSYMIVTQSHRGFINVYTSAGHGCTFVIKLPVN